MKNCLIEDKKSQEIIRTIRGLFEIFKIKTHDEDTGYTLFRHVLTVEEVLKAERLWWFLVLLITNPSIV
ncbi:MAG: hypothetical protein ACLTS1_08115 [Coprococcus sp.]